MHIHYYSNHSAALCRQQLHIDPECVCVFVCVRTLSILITLCIIIARRAHAFE